MTEINKSVNIASEMVYLGRAVDMRMTQDCESINDKIESIRHAMKNTLSPLKTKLENIKNTSPNAEHFDLTAPDLWNLIIDFEHHYRTANHIKSESLKTDEKTLPAIGIKDFEQAKKVSRADLEELISKVGDALDDQKLQLPKLTQDLHGKFNLALTLYDSLNRTLRSILQGQERWAQQTKSH